MFRTLTHLSLGLTLLSSLIPAQDDSKKKLVAFGGSSDRKASTAFVFEVGPDNRPTKMVGWANVSYGTAKWKADYDKYAKSDKAFQARLGSGPWASLDSSLDLNIGGAAIRAGHYGLAIGRGADGFYILAMNGNMIRRAKRGPWDVAKAQSRLKIPLQHKTGDDLVEDLSINLEMSKENPLKGTLTLAWGPHRLSAAVTASEAKPPQRRGNRRRRGGDEAGDGNGRGGRRGNGK